MSRFTPLLLLIAFLDLRCGLSIYVADIELTAQFLVEICTSQDPSASFTGNPHEYVPPPGFGVPKRLEGGGAR